MNRRNLISKLILSAGVLFLGSRTVSAKPKSLPKGVFIHHVFFWMKDPMNMEDRRNLEAGLTKLSSIDLIKTRHIGIPANTNRDVIERTYQYSILFTFKNKADQDIYQSHPDHLKFVDECSHLWKQVTVFDTVDIGSV